MSFYGHSQTALDFEETLNQYVDMGNSMNATFTGTNNITLEGWVKLESSGTFRTIVGNYSGSMQFLLRVDNGSASFWVDNGTGFQNVVGTSTIPVGTWTHIAGSWDGTTQKVFVNGVLENSIATSGNFPSVTNPVAIGGLLSSEDMDGLIDEVRIWNVARKETEIMNYMNSCLEGNEQWLVARYSFETGTGTTLVDQTGNGYDGILVNSPAWVSGFVCTPQETNIYSAGTGVPGWQTASVLLNNFSTCQSAVYIDAYADIYNGFSWSPGSFTLTVNGTTVGTFTSPQTIDLTSYIPVSSVQVSSSASTWHTAGAYVTVVSPSSSTPEMPLVSNINYCQGDISSPINASVTGTGTSLNWYTNINGAQYSNTAPTPNTSVIGSTSYWVSQSDASGCESQRQEVVVNVISPSDQPINTADFTVSCSLDTMIELTSSDLGVQYFLRDNSDNSIVYGPIAGTGSALQLNTNTVASTTTYNVYASGVSRALDLKGSNNYAYTTTPSGLPTGGTMTVEAWVKPNSYPDTMYNGVVSWGARNCFPAGESFLLSMSNTGRPSFAGWCNDFVPTTGPTANLNEWNHIAVVTNGTTVKLYLNGYEWTSTLALTQNVLSGDLYIGSTDLMRMPQYL
jgi:hypothetical protein